jgi:dihydrolipoamide dehydrogenase
VFNARIIPGVAYTDPEMAWLGTQAGDMIGKIALSIERGADAVDNGKTIHLQPKLGDSIGMAAEVAHGSCTDVPPSKR